MRMSDWARSSRCAVACVALSATIASSRYARADDASNAATAQELFDEAIELMKAHQYSDACPKLVASQRQDPGAGTQLALAHCYEKNGQTASAWAMYGNAASAAHEQTGHPEWEPNARAGMQALEPTLSRLTIRVPNDLPDLVVQRDGAIVDRAAWGSAIPVDPGPHQIVASAAGHTTWTGNVDVPAEHASVHVIVPALDAEAPPPPVVVAVPPPSPVAPPAEPPVAETSSRGAHAGATQRTVGLVAMGVGGVGVAVASVFGLLAMSTHSDALRSCDALNRCSQDGLDRDQTARNQAGFSTGFFAGSLIALGAGAVLYFTAPSSHAAAGSTSASVALRVAPAAGGAAAALFGAW